MHTAIEQLTFLEPDTQNENWFDLTLNKLGIKKNSGWPDVFGKKLKEWLEDQNVRHVPTLSLFSGGRGLDIAFHDAGFDIVEMVEIDTRFASTLTKNTKLDHLLHGGRVVCEDIRSYSPPDDMNIEFIIGGPPCQTFSAAGRRASGVKGTSDPRGTLFEEYVRILKQLKPRGFLFENVYGIVGAEGGEPWKLIQSAFRDAGYIISSRILDAADYGVPQHRERLFIVGYQIDDSVVDFKFPRPTHGPDSLSSQPYYSAGEAVKTAEVCDVSRLQVSGRWKDLLSEIPPGLNYSYYSSEMGHPRPVFAWRSKFSDFLYKADPNFPVRTIKAQGGAFTGPLSWENRHFSTSELKRLQTFPDSYEISGQRNVQVHQIGNSVPPQLGRILAMSVLDQLFKLPIPHPLDYLKANESLGFRTRKRNLTKHYRDIALRSINNNHIKTDEKKSNYNYSGNNSFSLSSKFDFHEIAQSGSDKFTGRYETKEKSLNIFISNNGINDAGFSLIIRPSSSGWNIPFSDVNIYSCFGSHVNLTAAWKYFEFIIRSNFGIDDLVQLSGYYQYTPKIISHIFYNDNTEHAHKKVIAATTSGIGVSIQANMSDLSTLWGIGTNEVFSALQLLKSIGFEVRSNRTNPQIPVGEYLIPYTFPTLNPKSVQLFKSI